MKPSSFKPLGPCLRISSANSGDAQTVSIPARTSALLVTVETNPGRLVFLSTGDPTSNTGLIIQKDQNPWFIPVDSTASPKWASTVGAAAVLQVQPLE